MMTARFLIHLREWEHKGSYPASHFSLSDRDSIAVQFKQSEKQSSIWSINANEFGVDPVLQAEREINMVQR